MDERGDACAQCGYSLYGLPSRRCPECGLENLDPEEVRRVSVAWFCSWRGLLLTRPPAEWGRAAAERTVRWAAWRRVLLIGMLPWLLLWGGSRILSHLYAYRTYDRGIDVFSTRGPALADYGRKTGRLIELSFAWRQPYLPRDEADRITRCQIWTLVILLWLLASAALIETASGLSGRRWPLPSGVAISWMALPSAVFALLLGLGLVLKAVGLAWLDAVRMPLLLCGVVVGFVLGRRALTAAVVGWVSPRLGGSWLTRAFVWGLQAGWIAAHLAAAWFVYDKR